MSRRFRSLNLLEPREPHQACSGKPVPLALPFTVHCKTINWRKSNQQMHWNFMSFLKIYLFIYRTNMFRLFCSHHQGACYMVQWKNNMYIFQDTVIYIIPQPAVIRHTRITTQINIKRQNIFNILFIVLTHGKLKLKDTNVQVNNCILENIHIALPLYHIIMARE
jgi:hypothetical protein